MAGDWIKFEMDTFGKPEVKKIARLTGLSSDAVVGKLLRVWTWFDKNSVDGVVDGVVDSDVDGEALHEGFALAMVDAGWMRFSESGESCEIPNFDRHNGKSAKSRHLKTERQAKWRKSKAQNVDARVDALVDGATSNKRREEKRREEKSKDHTTTASPEAENGSSVEFYLTAKKRKLTGKRLETFCRFWTAFGYPKGKAQAADAWLDIPTLTGATVEEIIAAAKKEAQGRKALVESGKTPKFAQGWLTARRWEDYAEAEAASKPQHPHNWRAVVDRMLADPEEVESIKAELRGVTEWEDVPKATRLTVYDRKRIYGL